MLFFFQVQYQNLVNELIKNFIIFHEVWLLNVILVSHLRLANFITIDAHNQIISKEVATVHKNFDRNTRSSSSSLSSSPPSSSLVIDRISFRMTARGRSMRNTYPVSPMLSSECFCLFSIVKPIHIHYELSGNTTTMIQVCLATTKIWTSKRQQTTVRQFKLYLVFEKNDTFEISVFHTLFVKTGGKKACLQNWA